MTDEDIDYSDIPPLDDEFFSERKIIGDPAMSFSHSFFYVAVTATTGAALYVLEGLYWYIVRRKVENTGIFRDDRRMNDWR